MVNRRDILKLAGVGFASVVGVSLLPNKHKPPKKRRKKMPIQLIATSNSGLKSGLSTYEHDHENVLQIPYQGIVVGISILGAGSVTSIRATYAFPILYKDLTFVRADQSGSTVRTEIWVLTASDGGTLSGIYTIEPTFSGSVNSILGAATFAWFGGFGTSGGATGTGSPAAKALTTTQNNSTVMEILAAPTTSGITDSEEQFNLWNAPSASGTSMGATKGIIPSPASTTLQWGNIGAFAWAVSAVELLSYQSNPPALMGR